MPQTSFKQKFITWMTHGQRLKRWQFFVSIIILFIWVWINNLLGL